MNAVSYDLYLYTTGEYLRPATPDEVAASIDAEKRDGGAGIIVVDGVKVYAR